MVHRSFVLLIFSGKSKKTLDRSGTLSDEIKAKDEISRKILKKERIKMGIGYANFLNFQKG